MKNIIIMTIVIGGIGIIGYLFSQTSTPVTEAPTTNTEPVSSVSEQPSPPADTQTSGEMDMSGIHIMADGSVMLGNGEVVSDAVVTSDGLIEMPDGQVVEPMMDMR